jgi:hypothetical protein
VAHGVRHRGGDTRDAALPTLDEDACVDLLAMSGIAAAGLLQAAHPPPQVVALQAKDPGSVHCPDFAESLTRFVRVYLTGLLAEARAG